MFNSRDPIVMGVIVEAGIVKEGTPICVPTKGVSKDFLFFFISMIGSGQLRINLLRRIHA